MRRYLINKKTYIQKPLVLGQIKQLTDAMSGITIDMSLGILGIVSALGNKLPIILAAVLIPEGTNAKERAIDAIAADLKENCDVVTAIEVIEDFFTCNPTALVLQKLAGAMKEMSPLLTGLRMSPASSLQEISPNGNQSYGE